MKHASDIDLWIGGIKMTFVFLKIKNVGKCWLCEKLGIRMQLNAALILTVSILAFQESVTSKDKKKTSIQSVTFKFTNSLEKNVYRSGKRGKTKTYI